VMTFPAISKGSCTEHTGQLDSLRVYGARCHRRERVKVVVLTEPRDTDETTDEERQCDQQGRVGEQRVDAEQGYHDDIVGREVSAAQGSVNAPQL
jgi:hypothetical protein